MTPKLASLAVALSLAACGSPKVSTNNGSTDPDPLHPSGSAAGGSGGGSNGGTGKPGINLPDASTAVDTGPPPVSEDANCGLKNFNLQRRPAEMLLVLDRSGSMRDPPTFMGLTSKWDETVPALHETVMKTAGQVQWGLKLFPGDFIVCNVADGVEVPPAIDNYPKVGAAIMGTTPTGNGTPTRYAIQKAIAYFQSTASINSRYIVLATDGEPNCADGMTNSLEDADGAVEAVRMANMAGYKTYVVGIATNFGTASATLDRLADAGGTARMGMPRYYPVASKQDLISTLSVITGKVADCVFPLDQMPPSPNDVAVDVDGARLGRDMNKMSGWDYGAGNKSIEIYGAACEKIKAGTSAVKIIFGCPGMVIP
jgi:hypothetical protein